MALSGFPATIDVVLGSVWSGRNGLSDTTALSLLKVSGQDKWSEDGTTTYNASTNRLMLEFTAPGGTANVLFNVGNNGTNQTAFQQAFAITLYLSAGSPATYTFLDIFNAAFPNLTSKSTMAGTPSTNYAFTTASVFGSQYDTIIFSTMEEGGAAAPTADSEMTGQGTIEAASSKGANADTVVTAQGTIEAASHPGVDQFLTGQGTAEAASTSAHHADTELTSQGTIEAAATSAHHADTEMTAQGTILAVVSAHADPELTGQGTIEIASRKVVISATELTGQGSIEAATTKGANSNAELTAQGAIEATSHEQFSSFPTAQGTLEAASTSAHHADTELTSQGTLVSAASKIHSDGSDSIGPDQSPHGASSNYPFVKPGDDIVRILGDLYLSYDDDVCAFTLPFSVAWMAGFGDEAAVNPPGFPTLTHAQDVVIKDATGLTVFDSTTASRFVAVPFGDRLESLQWEGSDAVLRVTRHTAIKVGDPPLAFPRFIEPTNGEMDGRTYNRMPMRVRSFRVGLVTVKAENVIWDEGFNFSMNPGEVVTEEGGRRIQPIEITANPGDGTGRVPACEESDPLVRRINNIGPDEAGNFTLDADGCYRIQRTTLITGLSPREAQIGHELLTDEEAAAAIQIFNDCAPCCECDDFVRTYEGLRNVDDQYFDLGQRAEATRDQHALNINRWHAARDCRIANPFRLVVQQEYDCTVAIGLNHCNLTEGCLTPLTLRMTLQVFKDGVIDPSISATTFVCPETVRNGTDTNFEDKVFTMAGTYPVFDTRYAIADPQLPAKLRTRLKFNSCANGQTLRITMSSHYPDAFKQDGSAANTPSIVTPPADIASLWAAADIVDPPRALVQRQVPLSPEDVCR